MNEPNVSRVLETVDRAEVAEPRPDSAESKSSARFRLTPVSELLKKPEPLRWLIKGYLLPGSLCLLFGEPAAGKSLIAMDWAACIATGREWYDHSVTQGPVVYIAGEGHFGISRRFKAWAIHQNFETQLSGAPLFVSDTGASFTAKESLNEVIDAVDSISTQHGHPVLIVIDTLHRNFGPGDENSSKDIAAFIEAADTLRTRYGATVLVVHHTGHGDKGRARGSSAIRAALDSEFSLGVR